MRSTKLILNTVRDLYLKYGGQNHRQIEREMRALGCDTFSRRVLYNQKTKTGIRLGWPARFAWKDELRSIQRADGTGGNATYGFPAAASASGVVAVRERAELSVPPAIAGGAVSSKISNTISPLCSAERLASPSLDRKEKEALLPSSDPILHSQFSTLNSPDSAPANSQPPASFPAWLKQISPNMTWDWPYQKLIYEHLNRITTGESKRLMIFLPPRHGKSELVTNRFAAWCLLNDPKMNIIIGSYNQRLANRFSRKIRITLEDAYEMQKTKSEPPTGVPAAASASGVAMSAGGLIPKNDNSKPSDGANQTGNDPIRENSCSFAGRDSQLSILNSQLSPASRRTLNTVAEWETGLGGGVRAVGVGGGITGFGADLVIIDDPIKSRAEAESKTYRERCHDWFNDDLYTRLEPGARIILIQTRWHEDDLAGRLLREMSDGGEHWDVICLPALAEVKTTGGNATSGVLAAAPASGVVAVRERADLSVPPAVAGGAVSSDPETIREHSCSFVAKDSSILHSQFSILNSSDAPPTPPHKSRLFSNREEWAEYDKKLKEYEAMLNKQPDLKPKTTDPQSSPPYETGAPAAASASGVMARERGDLSVPPADRGPRSSISAGVVDAGPAVSFDISDMASPSGSAERHASPSRDTNDQEATPPSTDQILHSQFSILNSSDPLNRQPGEPLCPERFSREDLLRIKRRLGSYSFSALYQQTPTPPEGGLFKRAWFTRIVDRPPENLRWCRGYDLAVSTKNNADYTASFRCAFDKTTGELYIADGMRKRMEFPDQRRFIVQKINEERNTEHGIEEALHGQAFIQDLRREHRLFGRAFRGIKVTADKFTRALAWANLAEDGKVILVRGPWIDAFLDEVCTFPNSQHDDQLDAVSLAVEMLNRHSHRAHGF
jgi:predicted phage terminase large subunit-like protein